MSNLSFYRKICEHIAKSCNFFFQGAWSEIQDKLPQYDIPKGEVIVTAASLWRHDRHILQGYLLLNHKSLCFLPLSDRVNFLSLDLEDLIRQDEKSTAQNILYIRDQDNIYQFICPKNEFVQLFHQKTRLPNWKLFWNELSPTARKRTIHKQRALLTTISSSMEAQMVELLLQEDRILVQTLTQDRRLPSIGSMISLNFTNSSGRHFFTSKIKSFTTTQKDEAQLKTPKFISLYSERESKRYPVGMPLSLAPLIHNVEKEEWLPAEDIIIGTLLDISETGCGITLPIDHFDYSRILIEIPVVPSVQLVGEVSQVQSFIQGGVRLGIFFITETPSIRFQLRQITQELSSMKDI